MNFKGSGKGGRSPLPWADVKIEYVLGTLDSYKAVADKLGCTVTTVAVRAKKENWNALRKAVQERHVQAAIEQYEKLEKSKVQEAIKTSMEAQTKFIQLVDMAHKMYTIRCAPWFGRYKEAVKQNKVFDEKPPLSAAEFRAILDAAKILQQWGNVAQGKPSDIHGSVVVTTDLLAMIDEVDGVEVVGEDGEE